MKCNDNLVHDFAIRNVFCLTAYDIVVKLELCPWDTDAPTFNLITKFSDGRTDKCKSKSPTLKWGHKNMRLPRNR